MGVIGLEEVSKLVAKGKAVVVDNSILKTPATCHTLAYVQHAMHVRARSLALPLKMGSAAHEALAHWLKNGRDEQAMKGALSVFDQTYGPVWKEAQKWAKENGETADARMEWARCGSILRQWMQAREGEKFAFSVFKEKTERCLVAPFGMKLKDGREVLYSARLDAQVRKQESALKWSMDHKTTTSASVWWIGKQKVSSQFSGQVWVSREADDEVVGVVINAIEFPRPHTSDNKCPIHKVGYQECTVRHAGGTYVFATRTDPELQAWKFTARKRVREMERLWERAKEEGWSGLGKVQMQGRFNEGCTFCDQKGWCDAGRPTGSGALKATFESYEWNPVQEQEGLE
jgi:hypothetical protein